MVSGGARARSGPAPDPDALRRERDAGDWTELPDSGRPGRPPKWPLAPKLVPESFHKRELEVWRRLWKLPQAIMWDRLQQHLEVALYVRRLVEAEVGGSPTSLSTLVRQMGDSLGLSTPGLRANRWKVVRPPEEKRAAGRSGGPSARDRFTVIPGDGS